MQVTQPYIQYMYSYPHKTAYGPLYQVHLRDYVYRLRECGLYFHIPFCQHKCGYCNLFSVAGQSGQMMRDYVDAMERQSQQLARILPEEVCFQDLTLGGGTPLLLPPEQLERVFGLAETYFGFRSPGRGIVVETSPDQTTAEKLALLKQAGVSRISIGVQSFREEELAAMGRFHTASSARRALRLLRDMDFGCLNVDLIYGVRGQTRESLADSLKQALEYEPEELFVYPLYIQPDTYLYRQGMERAEHMWEMYFHMRSLLREAGYRQYSMRRFVRPFKGRQNKASGGNPGTGPQMEPPYASCGFSDTLSVGCGGRSYIGNLHYCTPYAVKQSRCLSVLADYMKQRDYLRITHGFLLTIDEMKRRYAIRQILYGRGISRKEYLAHFATEVTEDFSQMRQWETAGYVTISDEFVTLTEEGMSLSDYLGPQLISPGVREKSERFFQSGAEHD